MKNLDDIFLRIGGEIPDVCDKEELKFYLEQAYQCGVERGVLVPREKASIPDLYQLLNMGKISTRTYKALGRKGFTNLSEICHHTRKCILNINGIGEKSIAEIDAQLMEYKLGYATGPAEPK